MESGGNINPHRFYREEGVGKGDRRNDLAGRKKTSKTPIMTQVKENVSRRKPYPITGVLPEKASKIE